eukprot:1145380-Pelagomonas_calceolata.AAC.2
MTGRVHGDVGQPTLVGYRPDSRTRRRGRNDHVLVLPTLFECVLKSHSCPPTLDTSDHGCIAVASYVPDVVPNADGTAFLEHVLCGMRRCASNLSLVLKHEQQLTSTGGRPGEELGYASAVGAALDAENIRKERKEKLRRQRKISLHQLRKRRHIGSEEPLAVSRFDWRPSFSCNLSSTALLPYPVLPYPVICSRVSV